VSATDDERKGCIAAGLVPKMQYFVVNRGVAMCRHGQRYAMCSDCGSDLSHYDDGGADEVVQLGVVK